MSYKQLFIGLGGQGGKTIREIKKVLYEMKLNAQAADGEANFNPFHCAFLSIDSSSNVWDEKQAWVHKGKSLALSPAEKCQLLPPPEGAVQEDNVVPWIYSQNPARRKDEKPVCEELIRSAIPGAGQKRRYGRVLFASNVDQVLRAVSNTFSALQQECGDATDTCVINVFCSLGGGTGSGGIVDLLTLLRQRFPNGAAQGPDGKVLKKFPINLYLYLSTDTSGDVGYFLENQYAALRDINSLITNQLRPHSLSSSDTVTNNGYARGKRIPRDKQEFLDVVDCVQVYTNKNAANVEVPIGDQIKRVAYGAVQRALLTDIAGDEKTVKIATGEDVASSFRGEPRTDSHLIERSFRFAGMGTAVWQAPINELRQLAVNSILANSFRQMIYNNPTTNDGYKAETLPLIESKLEKYAEKIQTRKFLLTKYVVETWTYWAKNDPKMTDIFAKGEADALDEMRQCFEKCYDRICRDQPDELVAGLSLPKRVERLLREVSGIDDDTTALPSSMRVLLYDDLMVRLREDWKSGILGLDQMTQVVDYVIERVNKCIEDLENKRLQKSPGGSELERYESSVAFRNNDKDGQWQKVVRLSFRLKGVPMLEAHRMELIGIYTMKIQCSHIDKMIDQLKFYIDDLKVFIRNLKTPREIMERYIRERTAEYNSLPLRSFIEGTGHVKEGQKLLYDFNFGDDRLKSLLEDINKNNKGEGITIVLNANVIREVVAKSMRSGTSLTHLFGNASVMDDETTSNIMKTAYGCANAMLAELDARHHTRLLGGIVERIINMDYTTFASRLSALLKQATMSYYASETAKSTGYKLANKAQTRFIVSFPRNISLGHLDSNEINLGGNTPDEVMKALQSKVRELEGARYPLDDYRVVFSDDSTSITVWQTEYGVPARSAWIVDPLQAAYETRMSQTDVNTTYWLDIDEQSKDMGASLTYPTNKEQGQIRDAAYWMAERCPDVFTLHEPEPGKLPRVSYVGADNLPVEIYNGLSEIATEAVLAFHADLVKQLSKAAESSPELISKLKTAYDEADMDERAKQATIYNKYIKPVLFRIAVKHQIPGLFDLD